MSIKQKILAVPTPLAGLALGIASLGWCWKNMISLGGVAQTTGAVIAGILLFFIGLKFILNPRLIHEELQHPVVGSVVPTFAMALMIISNSLAHWDAILGQAVWLFAVLAHVIFLIIFTYYRAKAFKWVQMVPAWFVPPVGLIVADVAFPGGALRPVADVVLHFGMLAYAILLPMMLYRFIFHENIQGPSQSTIAILAAPASLSLAGYLSVTASPLINVVALLAGIAVLMTGLIYLAFFRLMRSAFNPGYAAFTFPMVIGSTALFKLSAWMSGIQDLASSAEQIHLLAQFELLVASVVVLYVTVRYVGYFAGLFSAKVHPKKGHQ